MLKVFCDKCGNPIDYNINGVNIDFNHYGVVKFAPKEHKEYQLCDVCAKKVMDFVKGIVSEEERDEQD